MADRNNTHREHHNAHIVTHEQQVHVKHEVTPSPEVESLAHSESSKEHIYKTIEKHAISKESHTAHTIETAHHERPHHYITQTVKRGVYAHTLKNVQTHLKPSERRFSKIIHNDTIETLSELGAGTVARPSAILGGGIFMVFGGLLLLITARYFGFSIPLSSLLALYIVGFILLYILDLLSKPLRNRFKK